MRCICKADLIMFVVTGCSWEAMATFRKKVDNRIRVQIENGVAQHHRSMFVIVGDRGRDQVKHNRVQHYCNTVTSFAKPYSCVYFASRLSFCITCCLKQQSEPGHQCYGATKRSLASAGNVLLTFYCSSPSNSNYLQTAFMTDPFPSNLTFYLYSLGSNCVLYVQLWDPW